MKPPVILPDEGQLSEVEFMALGAQIAARSGQTPPSEEGGSSPSQADVHQPSAAAYKGDPRERPHALGPLPLAWPVSFGGRTVSEVFVVPPAWKDSRAVLQGDISYMDLYEIMLGEGPGFLDVLHGGDIDRVGSFCAALTSGAMGPAIGLSAER